MWLVKLACVFLSDRSGLVVGVVGLKLVCVFLSDSGLVVGVVGFPSHSGKSQSS